MGCSEISIQLEKSDLNFTHFNKTNKKSPSKQMLSYSGCVPDSAADKNICKVNQQECWINFPKITLKILFFNTCSPYFFFPKRKYRTTQIKRKLQDLELSYLLVVKSLETTQRFCYRQAPNPGISRCK